MCLQLTIMNNSESESAISSVINNGKPYAIIKREDDPDHAIILQGEIVEYDNLDDIPVQDRVPEDGSEFDTLSIIPFSQVKERGYESHDDGAKILCLRIKSQTRVAVADLLEALPDEQIALAGDPTFSSSDAQYEEDVQSIVDDEIGKGAGSNFVLSRKVSGKIEDMSNDKALSFYRGLLQKESGSYWSFIYNTGESTFVGATPERHISVEDGKVSMNPISGTFRKLFENLDGMSDDEIRELFSKFLKDPKEIYELLMVVDEELKMMSELCSSGGTIIGPMLKEMSKLVHTEYVLEGRSERDVIELLRSSMFAATVTGSPVESACSIIKKYEKEARRYYASALALVGRDERGGQILDSPITIRTMEIRNDGSFEARVGASIVRDSDPHNEMLETRAKMAGVLSCLTGKSDEKPAEPIVPKIMNEEMRKLLISRNKDLSQFWFADQEDVDLSVEELAGKSITIVDNEDNFCHMMAHMIERMGVTVNIVGYSEYEVDDDNSDLTIVGPGPGDPNDTDSEKMQKVGGIIGNLGDSGKKFLAVCLGHQLLCRELGMKVAQKADPSQGTQKEIDYFGGEKQKVGFYNTFAAQNKEIPGIESAYDKETGEVHALRSENFASYQFHPESVLSQSGFNILRDTLVGLIGEEEEGQQWRRSA